MVDILSDGSDLGFHASRFQQVKLSEHNSMPPRPMQHSASRSLFSPRALGLCTALALAATSGQAVAQNDYDHDKTSAATLGTAWTFADQGATPNTLLFFGISLNGGPTPIAAFDPRDTRSLGIGTDLIAGWPFVATGTGSNVPLVLNLPLDASLAGIGIYTQTFTFNLSGDPTFVADISNTTYAQLAMPSSSQLLTNTLPQPLALATPVFDRTSNGGMSDVALIGGGSGTVTSPNGSLDTALFGFRDLDTRTGTQALFSRGLPTVTVLSDGRALIVGGVDAGGSALSSCTIYDPASGSFTVTGSLNTGRAAHGATLLPNGDVLVAGGSSAFVDPVSAVSGTLRSAEVWSATGGTWTTVGNLGENLLAPGLSTLSDGRVMVHGGVAVTFFIGIPLGASSTTTCQFFSSGSFSGAPSMQSPRAIHDPNQIELNDGRLLVSGGIDVPSLLGAMNSAPVATAEVFDPSTNSWTLVPMAQARVAHAAVLLDDGRAVVLGGAQGTLQTLSSTAGTEIFDPTTNTWSAGPTLQQARAAAAGVVMANGAVYLLGGQGGPTNTTLVTIELLTF